MRSKYRTGYFSNTITNSYETVFDMDLRSMGDIVFLLKNMDGAIAVQYKMYCTTSGAYPDPSDDSWFNVLNTDPDPKKYDPDKEIEITAGKMSRETLSNKFGWMRIDMKSTSGTPVVKIWARGNQFQ